MGLAEFARQSYIWSGLGENEILGIASAMEFGEEEFAVLRPSVLAYTPECQHEEMLAGWLVDGAPATFAQKARVQRAMAAMSWVARYPPPNEAGLRHRSRLGWSLATWATSQASLGP